MLPTTLAGARTHNLKGVDLELAPGEVVVVHRRLGRGQEQPRDRHAYAEGQRRFVESFSPYARQFLERLERPPMDAPRAGAGRHRGRSARAGQELALDGRDDGRPRAVPGARCSRAKRCRSAPSTALDGDDARRHRARRSARSGASTEPAESGDRDLPAARAGASRRTSRCASSCCATATGACWWAAKREDIDR